MPKKALILSSIEGHTSIAAAIEKTLKSNNWKVETYTTPDPWLKIYRQIYRKNPKLMKVAPLLVENNFFIRLINLYLRKIYRQQLDQQLSKHQPDIIISTNYAFDPVLSDLKKETKIPYINILVDPKTFYSISLSQSADVNCVFDQQQQKLCQQRKPNAKTSIIGWLVQDQFEQKYDQKKIRSQLKLKDQTTFLFATGWEGTEVIFDTIKKLTKFNQLQIIIACGTNKNLWQKIVNLKKGTQSTLLPLKFTDKLHLYMQAADLVIGKAGPNTIFESVATLTPFMATTHIPGQEDGNLEIINDYQLGYVQENSSKAIQLLNNIVERPNLLKKFQPSLKELAKLNHQSKQKLSKVVANLTN